MSLTVNSLNKRCMILLSVEELKSRLDTSGGLVQQECLNFSEYIRRGGLLMAQSEPSRYPYLLWATRMSSLSCLGSVYCFDYDYD